MTPADAMRLGLVVVRTDNGAVLRLYEGNTLVVEVPLSPRQAMLVGLDLINIASAPIFSLGPDRSDGS